MNAYNDIIIDAANQLRVIDELTAPVKAATATQHLGATEGVPSDMGR
jgi:hypothetical protein